MCIVIITFSMYRYASRCLMVEFSSPPLSMTLTKYMELAELWEGCSPCAQFCVSLGESFSLPVSKKWTQENFPSCQLKLLLLCYLMFYHLTPFCTGSHTRLVLSALRSIWSLSVLSALRSICMDSFMWQQYSSSQLLKEAKMDHLEGTLKDHFCTNVLSCASCLQSAGAMDTLGDPGAMHMTVYTADQFGEELLQCMQGLPAAEVLLLLTAANHVK